MKQTVCIVTLFAMICAVTPTPARAQLDEPLQTAEIKLEIEALLIDSTGIHPLDPPNAQLAGLPGSSHRVLRLGEGSERNLIYILRYELTDEGALDLSLERKLYRHDTLDRELPVEKHRMAVTESWTTTIMEDVGTGGRLILRVSPLIRPAVKDEPFDSTRLGMTVMGGPMILYGADSDEDRVVFREVNVSGTAGLSLGVPGVGRFKIAPREFPGAVDCGWVRGHRWKVSVDGNDLGGWSTVQILPDDPRRPGAGWILYGAFEPDSVERGFYGGLDFEP